MSILILNNILTNYGGDGNSNLVDRKFLTGKILGKIPDGAFTKKYKYPQNLYFMDYSIDAEKVTFEEKAYDTNSYKGLENIEVDLQSFLTLTALEVLENCIPCKIEKKDDLNAKIFIYSRDTHSASLIGIEMGALANIMYGTGDIDDTNKDLFNGGYLDEDKKRKIEESSVDLINKKDNKTIKTIPLYTKFVESPKSVTAENIGTDIYKLLVLMNMIQKNYEYFIKRNINMGHFFYEKYSGKNIMSGFPQKFIKLDYTAENQVKTLDETLATQDFLNIENVFFPFLGENGYFQNEPRKELIASVLRSIRAVEAIRKRYGVDINGKK